MGLVKKAVREKVKVKVLLSSPSGGGKSYSALRLTTGMGGKTMYIGTEARRGLYYADEFDYDYVELKDISKIDRSTSDGKEEYDEYTKILPRPREPFAPENYIALINYAVDNGYDNLIIDSITHEWNSKGGILDAKSKMTGNDFAKWKTLTPRHDAFIYEILHSPINVIATVRGKDAYVLEENSKGKQAPKKVGLGSITRDGIEFEYTVAMNIDQETHIATATKDNTHLFDNRWDVLTETDGKALIQWAESGKGKNISRKIAEKPAETKVVEKKPEKEITDLQKILLELDSITKEKAQVNLESMKKCIEYYNNGNLDYRTITDIEVAKNLKDGLNQVK